jgi:hypothetical protein
MARLPSAVDARRLEGVDGALTRVGAATDILTIDEFGDFELTVDWNLSADGNSGILYRVTEDQELMWQTAPEFQVIDNAYREPLKPGQLAGANYDLHPRRATPPRPIGTWNETRIVARGSHVEHWLNGVKVVEYELWSDDWQSACGEQVQGPAALRPRQTRAHRAAGPRRPVAYRNFKIREIKGSTQSRKRNHESTKARRTHEEDNWSSRPAEDARAEEFQTTEAQRHRAVNASQPPRCGGAACEERTERKPTDPSACVPAVLRTPTCRPALPADARRVDV